jgi:hypothetical protein
VVTVNGLVAILFMSGYVLLGIAMIRTATLPRWSGVLAAVGAPAEVTDAGSAATNHLVWRQYHIVVIDDLPDAMTLDA